MFNIMASMTHIVILEKVCCMVEIVFTVRDFFIIQKRHTIYMHVIYVPF